MDHTDTDADTDTDTDADTDTGQAAPVAVETPRPAPTATPKARQSKGPIPKATVRRIAETTLAIQDATPAERQALAALLRCPANVADLVAAVHTSGRSAARPVADILEIADAEEPLLAGVTAAALGRSRLRAAWALLDSLGRAPASTVPTSDAKAALALAKSAQALDAETIASLSSIMVLARPT